MKKEHLHTNQLIDENSPYLLQHAHNPVNWLPWNNISLEKAKKEDKPILISIGYSACHWCHVMEKESFEDEEVAKIMNEHFICIKVDREERPDIDQIYMSAVQLMTNQGGWPLNCFALADGRPFYGGTYFPKEKWKSILIQLSDLYQTDKNKVIEYADRLANGMQQSELIEKNEEEILFSKETIIECIENWRKNFDPVNGGPNKAPKFPLPNNYEFLMYANYILADNHPLKNDLQSHIRLTLKKMAYGGIYDQIGGGFSRYTVDDSWKIPHFEKMLYDNAQLISLYAKAYQFEKNPLYKKVVEESIEFVKRELMHENAAFYSALDADSEGEEGKYYVWKAEELKSILQADFKWISSYFNINSKGYWENGNYILTRNKEISEIAKEENTSADDVENIINTIKQKLHKERLNRTKVALDDKSLTSWNAMMITALLDAYRAFGTEEYLNLAIKNADFLIENQLHENHSLWHNYKNGNSTILGFLEDYAFCIEAFIHLYECSSEQKWLVHAENLSDYCFQNFYDEKSSMFYFTDSNDQKLIVRKMEIMDNVIPSSNSVMANALFKLGHLTYNEHYISVSKQMLKNVMNQIPSYGTAFSNWAILFIHQIILFYEVAIVGENNKKTLQEFLSHYRPNKVVAASNSKEKNVLEIFKGKKEIEKTMFYVCENKSCQVPTDKMQAAIQQIFANVK